MGNPLSPVLANIFMAKLEADVVRPFNPPSYDRYVDECFSKKKGRASGFWMGCGSFVVGFHKWFVGFVCFNRDFEAIRFFSISLGMALQTVVTIKSYLVFKFGGDL